MKEKVDPYLRPLYDALYDLFGFERVQRKIDSGEIEVEYDTKRVGIFMKAISVVSNSKNSSIVLRIKGEVLEEEDEEEDEEKNNI